MGQSDCPGRLPWLSGILGVSSFCNLFVVREHGAVAVHLPTEPLKSVI